MNGQRFYGKYRGKVAGNVDPHQVGRVQVQVPSVYGDGRMNWAMPCVPYAGDGVGLFVVPPVGANVWVEFEGGDSDFPIWVGGFWDRGQPPANPPVAETKVLKTGGATITISDAPGAASLTIELNGGASLKLSSQGVELAGKGAKVSLSGTTVSINDGALEVS